MSHRDLLTSGAVVEAPTAEPLPAGVTFRFLGEGTVGGLIRAKDWSETSVGPVEAWPTSLKSYASMILTLPTPAIIFWGRDQVQIYNDGYAVIMGPRHPKYLGATYRACWPDTYPTIYPWMQRVLRDGEVVEVNRTLIPLTRHGFNEEAFFSFTFSPLRDDAGERAGILQIVTEMTAAVLAERRLETLRALAPSHGAARLDVQDNVLRALSSNPSDIRFARLYLPVADEPQRLQLAGQVGLEQGAQGAPPTDTFSDVVREAFTSGATQVIEDVQRRHPHQPAPPWPEPTQAAVALPLRRLEGEAPRGVIVLGVSPRLHFDDTYRAFFEGIAREIAVALGAAQERAAQERSRQELYQFFMQAPVPMVVLLGPEHRFFLANPPYEQFVGRPVTGKALLEAFTREEVGPFLDRLDHVFQTGEPFIGHELPLSLPGPSGTLQMQFIHVGYHPFRDPDGTIRGVLAVLQNVTEQVVARKEIEELALHLQEAVRARDEFMSIASHELKTPLSSLKLESEIIKRSLQKGDPLAPAPGPVKRLIEQTDKQVSRLARLVDDMLDVSRVQTGRLAIQPEELDLAELVSDVIEKLRPQMTDALAPPTFAPEANLHLVGAWDRMRLEQVVINLLTNAMRYGGKKPVVVRLRRDGASALLSVHDQGIGISSQAQKKIFNRFERAVSPNEVSGLGLGLYITAQIIRAHGGRIWVESEIGRGSTFFVELPIAPASGERDRDPGDQVSGSSSP